MGKQKQGLIVKSDAQLIQQNCAWLMTELGGEKDRFIHGISFAIKMHPHLNVKKVIDIINSNRIAMTKSMDLLIPKDKQLTDVRRFEEGMREVLFAHVAAATVIGCIYRIDPRILVAILSKECSSTIANYQSEATSGKGAMQLYPGSFAREFATVYTAMKKAGIPTSITKPIEDSGHPNEEATAIVTEYKWNKGKRAKMNAVAYDTHLIKGWGVPTDIDRLKESEFTKDSFVGQDPFANVLGGMLVLAVIAARHGHKRSSLGNDEQLVKLVNRYNSVHSGYGRDFLVRFKQIKQAAAFIGWEKVDGVVPTRRAEGLLGKIRPTKLK